MRADRSIAFAGGVLQTCEVRDFDNPSGVPYDTLSLQSVSDRGYAIALYADHLGQGVLGQMQCVLTRQVVHAQQTTRQARFGGMHCVACR